MAAAATEAAVPIHRQHHRMAAAAAHWEVDAALASSATTLLQLLREAAMTQDSILTTHAHAALHPIHVHAATAEAIAMQAAIVRAAPALQAPTTLLAATAATTLLHVL